MEMTQSLDLDDRERRRERVLLRAVEAIVFAADEPASAGRIARSIEHVTGHEVSETEVAATVEQLNHAYQQSGRVLRIESWAGGFRLATIDEVAPFITALQEDQQARRLSRSLMETLAVVAYRQPVTKTEIDFVRGVNSDYALRRLLELGLIALAGRAEGVGRPLLYASTEHFLDQFALRSLEDLPKPRELEELLADPAVLRERAALLSQMGEFGEPEDGSAVDEPQPENDA